MLIMVYVDEHKQQVAVTNSVLFKYKNIDRYKFYSTDPSDLDSEVRKIESRNL